MNKATALEELTATLSPDEFHPSVYGLDLNKSTQINGVEFFNNFSHKWMPVTRITKTINGYVIWHSTASYSTRRQMRGDAPIRLRNEGRTITR